ncbi:hypothetical protein D3C87_777660 [compost metagenome]
MRTNMKNCRYCGMAIIWARGLMNWLPVEPDSIPEQDRHNLSLSYDPTAHTIHRCKGKGAA